MSLHVIPDIFCILICGVATVIDVRTGRIPNWLTGTGVALGLLLNLAVFTQIGGFDRGINSGFLPALAGGAALLVTFGIMGFAGFVGMGDVKLMAAVGVLLRWPNALWALAYVTLCGGLVALLYTLARGQLGRVLGNLVAMIRRGTRQDKPLELHHVPYGLAILLGAAWAAGRTYFSWLRFP